MTWALKRQFFYVFVLIVFFGIFGFLVIYPHINKAPSCSDGIQDGDETGIDCGGSCATACTSEVDEISILWTRSFEVVPGRYNAVAYLENHNKNAAIDKITYNFRFYDKNDIYIGEREGSTFIPASGKFAIFEPGVGLGNSIPVYTNFQFTEAPLWQTVPQDKLDQLKILISNIKLENEDTSPRLSATIQNDSFFSIPGMSVVALLYDDKGNALAASSTYIDTLEAQQSQDLNYTWPEPIQGNAVAEEIIPMYNIFLTKL
jgi:hypothetical protein